MKHVGKRDRVELGWTWVQQAAGLVKGRLEREKRRVVGGSRCSIGLTREVQ